LKAHGIGLRIKKVILHFMITMITLLTTAKNGAGIENYNFITTAGLKYTF